MSPAKHMRTSPLASIPHIVQRWCAEQLCNQLQLEAGQNHQLAYHIINYLVNRSIIEYYYLLDWTLRLEQYPSSKKFSKNATHAPNVNGCRIMSGTHKNFRSSIVLRHHFLSHMFVLIGFFDTS